MALLIGVRSTDTDTSPLSFDSPRIVIGRGPGSDIQLPDPSVSHRHASIRQRGKDYIVLDEDSTNGTFVGPVRLSRGAPRVLKHGDLVRVGRIWLEIEIDPGALPTPSQLTRELALRLVAGALDADGHPSAPSVRVVEGPDQDSTLTLAEFRRPYVVGRVSKCDLILADEDVSRRHVEIVRSGSDVVLKDLSSKNGSLIAGQPIGGEHRWATCELLQVGNTILELSDPLQQTLSEIEASPDEVVDESMDPPDADARQSPDVDVSEAVARSSRPGGSTTERPTRQAPRRTAQRTTWSTVDVLVALVAVTVFAISAAGFVWLLGG
jgi:pSer/pThr/pTyr-binding forkhead associated (FHA) protein